MGNQSLSAALEKLCKWRKFFASWQLGTRLAGDGELRAVTNHREATILLRAEVSALAYILLSKGICTEQEWQDALAAEAVALDHLYQQNYPGWSSTADGLRMKLPEAAETMKKLGFPR